MKKQYESPVAEELLILSESVMTDSSDVSEEETIIDDETRDMTVDIAYLLGVK